MNGEGRPSRTLLHGLRIRLERLLEDARQNLFRELETFTTRSEGEPQTQISKSKGQRLFKTGFGAVRYNAISDDSCKECGNF